MITMSMYRLNLILTWIVTQRIALCLFLINIEIGRVVLNEYTYNLHVSRVFHFLRENIFTCDLEIT